MRLSERDVKTNINSEIHASLRRLEDADYISETVQDEKLSTLADQVNAQIQKLRNEVYQLHTYIEPHIYNDDLQFFQTIYVGNLQVSEGGEIDGNLLIGNDGNLTVQGSITSWIGVDIYGEAGLFTPKIVMPDENNYTPHTLTVEGTQLTGKILASQDMSFSLVGLVEGNGSGDTYTIRTRTNHVSLLEIVVVPQIAYDSSTHKYRSYTLLRDPQGNVLLMSSNTWSGTEAYDAGSPSYPPNSATFAWYETVNGEAHFKRTSGDTFGRTSRTVYWDN